MEEIVEKVREAGVVGAGGAGFPTHIKLKSKVEYVIANGAECEPLLRVDRQLMETQADLIVRGLEIAMKTTGADKGIIALKGKYKEAVEALEKASSSFDDIEVRLLGNFYPAGDEHVLVYEMTGRIVPEGGIPLAVGVVVNNISTLINISHAVDRDQPVIHRHLTITGEVAHPKTLCVPVGTIIEDVIASAGGTTVEDFVVIDGGPMMGNIVPSTDSVKKTTSGLIILPREHTLIQRKTQGISYSLKRAQAICCQCDACTEMCPRYLLGHHLYPNKTMVWVNYELSDLGAPITSAYLCCECGLCGLFSCPMGLTPVNIYKDIKVLLEKQGIRNPHQEKDLTPNPKREYQQVPVHRLLERLQLGPYDVEAPLEDKIYEPNLVRIDLSQHLGAPAIPIIKVGDRVKARDLIGEIPEGSLSARVHASISGVVRDIDTRVTIEAD